MGRWYKKILPEKLWFPELVQNLVISEGRNAVSSVNTGPIPKKIERYLLALLPVHAYICFLFSHGILYVHSRFIASPVYIIWI